MDRPGPWTYHALLAALALLVVAPAASAQSGAGLLLRPWQQKERTQLRSSVLIQGASHTREGRDDSFQLRWYEASGRHRFDASAEHSPAIGFELDQLDLDTPHPMLPERLADQSFGLGVPVGEWRGWEVGLTLGGGFAGDQPYDDPHALYAHANLLLNKETGEDTGWQLMLNYNGNRTFLPDVPLPGFAYYEKVSDELRYTVGLPFSSVTWRPTERWSFDLRYTLTQTVNATARYKLLDGLSAVGGFYNRFEAFHVDGRDEHRRLFFEQRRLEGGLRWRPEGPLQAEAMAGYAFDQEFSTGFDSRDLDNEIGIGDAPYVRFGLDWRF